MTSPRQSHNSPNLRNTRCLVDVAVGNIVKHDVSVRMRTQPDHDCKPLWPCFAQGFQRLAQARRPSERGLITKRVWRVSEPADKQDKPGKHHRRGKARKQQTPQSQLLAHPPGGVWRMRASENIAKRDVLRRRLPENLAKRSVWRMRVAGNIAFCDESARARRALCTHGVVCAGPASTAAEAFAQAARAFAQAAAARLAHRGPSRTQQQTSQNARVW